MPILAGLPIRTSFLARAVSAAVAIGTPTLRAVTGTATSSTASKAISTPSGVQNNDIMIAAIYVGNTTSVLTAPAGWNFIQTTSPGALRQLVTYWRRASSEPASYTWTLDVGVTIGGFMIAYSDCLASGTPIEGDFTSNTGSSTTSTALGLTTDNANTMLVMVSSTSGSRNYTASTLTEQFDDLAQLGCFDGLQAVAGASGNKTATLSSSTGWGAQLIAIKPSGGT